MNTSNLRVFLVGGAVRDQLLGLEPKDRDWLIVGATAHDVQRLLDEGYEQVGADFPVFLHPVTKEEYALARVERKTGDGYHGFEVDFSSTVTIEDDLARRDLTVNSMALDMSTGVLIDPYNGHHDLLNGILRNTSAAFAEDPLRVLRLARFAARFPTFRIAPETIELCKQISFAGELNHLAVERVWLELDKGLREEHPLIFMHVLSEVQALTCCEVLNEVFGSTLAPYQEAVCKVLNAIAGEERLLIGVATLALKAGAKLPGASKRLTDLYSYLFTFRNMEGSAPALAALLKRVGALREGPAFKDFCRAVTVLELAGTRHGVKFTARELVLAAEIVQQVRAQAFPELEGKELGAAIEEERVRSLHRVMTIPMIEGSSLPN